LNKNKFSSIGGALYLTKDLESDKFKIK